MPKPMEEIIGAIQCTCWYVVKAIQNRLVGTTIAPIRPLRRRASGGTSTSLYVFWTYLQGYLVESLTDDDVLPHLISATLDRQPAVIPTPIPMKASPVSCILKPCLIPNIIGHA